MLAQLSGTIINYSDVARTLGISAPTVRDFVESYNCPYEIVISNNERLGLLDDKLLNVPFSYV